MSFLKEISIVVQLLSRVQLFTTPGTAGWHASLSFTISWSLLKLMSTESVVPSYHLISVVPFFSCLQSFAAPGSFPISQLFTSGGQSIVASALASEYSGSVSFRIDWFDLLAVQGTLKSLPQHHNLKASLLQASAFFTGQLSHLYMTTGRTIALTIWTLVGKVMSLLFNTLSRFVIAFLPRSNHLLISRLQSPSIVILEHRKIKSGAHFRPE